MGTMTATYKGIVYKTHPYIEEYFTLIDSGQIVVCKEQHQLRDYVIQKLARDDVYIDAERVEKAVSMKEAYFYRLFPFQRFMDCFVYGVFYTDGSPVFNTFFIMMGRGNGKNGYISPNTWYMTTRAHGVRNYNIELVANSEQQVKTSFEDVLHMLEHPKNITKMRESYRWTLEKITSRKTGSVIRWHTSNAKTKDTLRSGCIVFDEVHQYENYSQLEVFTTGLGKLPADRVFYITTDGNVRGKVLDDFKQEAQETFAGERPDSRTFFFICKLDDKAEADNPAMWEKANPALRYFPELQRVITQQYNDYKNIPELWRGFITKRMNMPAQDTAAPVTDFVNIAAARNQLLPDGAERWADSTAFDGWPCIGGLDYAETSDYVGCGLLFRKLEKYYWLHHSFICAASLLKVKPSFSIEEAVDLGLCTIIKHQNIPAEMIAEWFTDKSNKYSIQRVAFDSYREAVVKKAFSDAGIVTDVIRKGSFTHAKIAPLLDVLYGNHNIIYGGDRMMSWYTNNVYKAYDGKGNVSYEKVEPIRRKTDGWHAFLAAMCSDFDKALPDGGPVNFASMRVRTY